MVNTLTEMVSLLPFSVQPLPVSSRVESRIGKGASFCVTSSGISVQPRTTALQPCLSFQLVDNRGEIGTGLHSETTINQFIEDYRIALMRSRACTSGILGSIPTAASLV